MNEKASPLHGLDIDQADEAIDALEDKIAGLKDSLKAAQEHLHDMKQARKRLPEELEAAAAVGGAGADSNGARAQAGAADASGEVE